MRTKVLSKKMRLIIEAEYLEAPCAGLHCLTKTDQACDVAVKM